MNGDKKSLKHLSSEAKGVKKTDFVVVGRIGAPFGIRGFCHIHSFTAVPDDLFNYHPWYLKQQDQWNVVELVEAKEHGKGFVAKLKGYEDRDEVAKLTNLEIGVKRESLPRLPPNQYYWVDLLGLTVVTTSNQVLGTIEDFLETGSNDVMVVRGNEKEHLIPYIDDYIVNLDLTKRVIQVDWDPEF